MGIFGGEQCITEFHVISVILSDLPTYGSQRKIGYCTIRQREIAVSFLQVNRRLLAIINQLLLWPWMITISKSDFFKF